MYFNFRKYAFFGFTLSTIIYIYSFGYDILVRLQYLNTYYSQYYYQQSNLLIILRSFYHSTFFLIVYIILFKDLIKLINNQQRKKGKIYSVNILLFLFVNFDYIYFYLNNETVESLIIFLLSYIVKLIPFLIIIKLINANFEIAKDLNISESSAVEIKNDNFEVESSKNNGLDISRSNDALTNLNTKNVDLNSRKNYTTS